MFLESLSEGAVKGFLEGVGDSVKNAVSAFKADPTKVVELETALKQAQLQYESVALQAVNATMQAEAKSEHWMQWSWRPLFGYTGCGLLLNNYVLLPYFEPWGIKPITVPSEVWGMIMVVLGVAAYTRGAAQIAEAKK